MSAFRSKTDITIAACPLLRSLLGVKRTWPVALHMSANDPKRTFATPFRAPAFAITMPLSGLGGGNEASPVPHAARRCGHRFAVICGISAATNSTGRISEQRLARDLSLQCRLLPGGLGESRVRRRQKCSH